MRTPEDKKRYTTIYLPNSVRETAVVRMEEIFGRIGTGSFSRYLQYLLIQDYIRAGLFDGNLDDPFEAKPKLKD